MNKPKRYGADGDPKWDGCFVEWEEYAKLSVELRRLRASSFVTNVPSEDFEKLETENARLQAEVDRLTGELKFSEHRMISLAEALADTRLGYQKKIEILKEKCSYLKCGQGTKQTDNKGKPSRSGGKGKSIGDKPKESGGTY